MSSFHSELHRVRRTRGWSQAQLAERSGLSRAEISAIETARLVPSTAAALKLAAALDTTVEALFRVGGSQSVTWAWPSVSDERRVWRAEVNGRTLLYPVEATAAGTLPHDAEVEADEVLPRGHGTPPPAQTLVLAGCDPMVGLLFQQLASMSGIRLVPIQRSSTEALALLRQGHVHVAGLHLCDPRRAAVHDRVARKALGGEGYRLLHLVSWQEGIAMPPQQAVRSIRGLMGSRARWVNREAGSGARDCLDHLLEARVRPAGYDRIVRDHRSVAATIVSGWATAGICVQPVAAEARLDFLPVRQEAYELCFPARFEDDPRGAALIAAVRSASYRSLLRAIPGFDATRTGELRAGS